jgi:hypothetical protein
MGYSLTTTSNVICNFLSMDDISGAFLEDPDSTFYDAECSFVVQVHKNLDSATVTPPNSGGSSRCSSIGSKGAPPAALEGAAEPVLDFSVRADAAAAAPPAPRSYHFKASSVAERDQWMQSINAALCAYQQAKAEQEHRSRSRARRLQRRLRAVYTGLPFQTSTALLVAINFFVTVSASAPAKLCGGASRLYAPHAPRSDGRRGVWLSPPPAIPPQPPQSGMEEGG